jgi:hypothetical protein
MHWSWPWVMNKAMYNISLGVSIDGVKHVALSPPFFPFFFSSVFTHIPVFFSPSIY